MIRFTNPLDDKDMVKTSEYGEQRGNRSHCGIDYGNNSDGNPIYSVASGEVIKVGWASGYGNTIVIKHSDGTSTLYGHMKHPTDLNVGDYVDRGQNIGKVGNTGVGTGPHLHFEHIDKDGTKSIEKYGSDKNLGLQSGKNRLNPNDSFTEATHFIWHSEEGSNTCEDYSSRDGKNFQYEVDEEPQSLL